MTGKSKASGDWIGPRPAIRPASSPVSPRCHPPLIGVGDGCEKTAEIWPICHIHKDRHAVGRVTWFADQGLRHRPANQVPIQSQLFNGRISAVSAERGHLKDLHLSSVQFTGCDLSQLRWENSRLNRVRRFKRLRFLLGFVPVIPPVPERASASGFGDSSTGS